MGTGMRELSGCIGELLAFIGFTLVVVCLAF